VFICVHLWLQTATACAVAVTCLTTSLAAQPRDRADRIADSVLALMTLDEKIGQLNQSPGQWGQTGPRAAAGGEQQVREGKIGSFLSFWGAAATRRMQRIAVEESRLHVPLLFAQDVIHGWRTVFPVPLAEAASFDTAAVEGAARIAADEATAFGHRDTAFEYVGAARWTDPAEDEGRIATARECAARLERYSSGVYVNVLGDDGMAGVRRAYPAEKLARLTALKDALDPDNIFHLNQNIPPTDTSRQLS